jgi:anti-sigma factor RsiW
MSHLGPQQGSEDCQQLKAELSDYLDGNLATRERRRLTQHLDECEDCQVLATTLEKTLELFGLLEQPEIPDQVIDRLWDRLEDKGCIKPGHS